MPSAQVLQAFFERIARHSLRTPPASRAFRQVYHTAGQPPPDLYFFIDFISRRGAETQRQYEVCDWLCWRCVRVLIVGREKPEGWLR